MKSRKLLLGGIAIAALAAVVAWSCRSEYGSGYSEDRRRNWNEIVAMTGGDGKAYVEELGNCWSYRAKNRQDQADAPLWAMKIPNADQNRLPLEGMADPVLKHLADQGNGKACLELVSRSFDNEYFGSGENEFCFPDFSSVYEVEMYLKKAVETGEPGADFLRRLFEYRKNGNGLHVKDMVGYVSFLTLMDQGCFLLGKVYMCLDPNGEEALSRLEEGLKRSAEQGDVTALRNRGHLLLLRKSRGPLGTQLIHDLQKGAMLKLAPFYIKMLGSIHMVKEFSPGLLSQWEKVDQFLKQWMEGREWKSIRRGLEVPVDILRESAKQGDLHAKYLWCRYMVLSQRSFSREDWEDYWKYVDELLQSGGIYRGQSSGFSNPDEYELVMYFYPRKSVWKMRDFLQKQSLDELTPFCSNPAVSPEMRWIELSSMVGEGNFADYYHHFIFQVSSSSREEQAHGFKLIERAAEEGEPVAMYYMAQMLNEEESIIAENGRKAWDFLQKLKTWRKGVKGKISHDYLGQDTEKNGTGRMYVSLSFDLAVNLQELDTVSRYGDMPGMTVKEGFEKFLILRSSKPREFWRSFDEMSHPAKVKEQFEKRGYKVPDEKSK